MERSGGYEVDASTVVVFVVMARHGIISITFVFKE